MDIFLVLALTSFAILIASWMMMPYRTETASEAVPALTKDVQVAES